MPTLRFERQLLRSGYASVACIDEAGRGALCGPVSVGVVLITADTKPAPEGVRDSKLLTETQRESLAPKIRAWTPHAVGMSSAQEIDDLGIIAAMRLAGQRAIAGLEIRPGLVLLDGSHDYLSEKGQSSLFDSQPLVELPEVITKVKADLQCAGVAAASILAKTARDEIMKTLSAECPAYGWEKNKGYAAADHLAALAEYGPTVHHRTSWKLPT